MLKTQHPTDYLKKERVNSGIIEQSEGEQYINERVGHIRSKRSDPQPGSSRQAEQSISINLPKFDSRHNSWQVHVPIDNSLFYSTTLACLVSVKDKDGDFKDRFESLFGNENLNKFAHVKALIQSYNPFLNAKDIHVDEVLKGLIQHFGNKVASYRPSVAGRTMDNLHKISAVLNCKIVKLGNSNIYALMQGSSKFELKLLEYSNSHYGFCLEKGYR